MEDEMNWLSEKVEDLQNDIDEYKSNGQFDRAEGTEYELKMLESILTFITCTKIKI